jgi:uncharacterized repeat protein (TIGR03803 family)
MTMQPNVRSITIAALIAAAAPVTAACAQSSLTTLYSFKGEKDGAYPPAGGPALDSAGNLYGTTASYPGSAFRLSPNGKSYSFTSLRSFNSTAAGIEPSSPLTPGPNGVFFGATSEGGKTTNCYSGCGIIFELIPPVSGTKWTTKLLYEFTGLKDGNTPAGNLALSSDGVLYGATERSSPGQGTIFSLTPPTSGTHWTFKTLYTFTGGADGGQPSAGVSLINGVLYGTAFEGGTSSNCSDSCGTAFSLTHTANGKSWIEATIYAFGSVYAGGNFTDGNNPISTLVADAHGVLYGTTVGGGTSTACDQGCGTVFSLTKTGRSWTETVLHSFTGVPDGYEPASPLVFDSTGALWGAAGWGGLSTSSGCQGSGCGTLFKLTGSGRSWTETTEYQFTGGTDGGVPNGIVFNSSGDLFGATAVGGPSNGSDGFGTIFEFTP